MEVTPSMRAVIAHLGEVGPRWGVRRETCAVHALLYLAGRPLDRGAIASALGLDLPTTEAAIADLLDWKMAERLPSGCIGTNGQPWDLLAAAFEERRRREIEPALRAFSAAVRDAQRDGTPPVVVSRITALFDLVKDVSAITGQFGRLSSRTLMRLVSLGGRASRLIGVPRP